MRGGWRLAGRHPAGKDHPLTGPVVEVLLGPLPGRLLRRAPVEPPRDPHVHLVGDGGQQVDVLPVAVVDPAGALAGLLDQQRHPGHLAGRVGDRVQPRPCQSRVKLTPWSAVSTTSDLSYRPVARSVRSVSPSSRSVYRSWARCRARASSTHPAPSLGRSSGAS